MTIFVTIVSYKDNLLWNTVNNCIAKCSDPSSLRFGIIDQSEYVHNVDQHPACDRITYLHIDPQFSRGPCWARSIALSFYNNEDYVLQIDSHTVFDKNWDLLLIRQLKECQEFSEKCILSTYPQAFNITEKGIKKNKLSGITTVLKPKNNATISEDDPSFSFIGYNVKSDKPILGSHVAGGFIFCPGNFFLEIPYDPSLYFIGEEQNIAIRAWTHGWDIYHPPDSPVYHLYYSEGNRTLHWDAEDDVKRLIKWTNLHHNSKVRLSNLLFQNKNLGIYGLGNIRTLEDFAKFSGIDYLNKTILTSI